MLEIMGYYSFEQLDDLKKTVQEFAQMLMLTRRLGGVYLDMPYARNCTFSES